MIINDDLLDKLAYLSRLELSQKERATMLHDLNEILVWIQQLDELDDVNSIVLEDLSLIKEASNLRRDVELNTLSSETALTLSCSSDSNYFRAPVVKGGELG